MVDDRRKEVIGKAKEIAGPGPETTEPALSTSEQISGRSPFPEHIASTGDAGKHCLGRCPDLKLLAPWPVRPVQLQLNHQEQAEQPGKSRATPNMAVLGT